MMRQDKKDWKNEGKSRSTWALKGLALFLGIMLWLFVTNENVIITRQTVSNVPVKAVDLEPGLKAVYTDRVDVEVMGPGHSPGAFNATIDLAGKGPGEYRVPVKVTPPAGVQVVKVVPAQVTVNIAEISEKVIPTAVKLVKLPPAGYRVTGSVVSPGQVLVRGSYSDLRRVAEARALLDLSAEKGPRTLPVTFVAVDSDGQPVKNVEVVPRRGEAYVVVEAERITRSLPLKAEIDGSVAPGYELGSVAVDPQEVSVVGPQDVVAPLTQVSLTPIDVTGKSASFVTEAEVAPLSGGAVIYPRAAVVSIEIKPRSEGKGP